MRKLVVSLMACLVVATMAACACKAEIAAVDRLGDQQEKLFKKYSAYVAADTKLTAEAKDDEMKLLESIRHLFRDVRKGLGD